MTSFKFAWDEGTLLAMDIFKNGECNAARYHARKDIHPLRKYSSKDIN